jgi:hypothetical protein
MILQQTVQVNDLRDQIQGIGGSSLISIIITTYEASLVGDHRGTEAARCSVVPI